MIVINTCYLPNIVFGFEGICKSIAAGTEVSLEDMIWAEKLAKANTSARGMIKQARRMKTNPNDSFLNNLNIGDSDSSGKQVRGFDNVDDMYNWFRPDRSDDWRQRD